ncbi:unnamed protein product [Eruca vesicaria subsp. sativa]|uniref:Uncharacterized protein n=1 Tax=Eruca vesicaria subsp. sativa TaxID=29727 RepID=A0ABC8KIP3_ERUVS|nr:unnamed protein product [Eruca vesicaria subsp. sativa]
MVEAKVQEDMSDVMQCINHPFTKNPGGICPLCLQEKLGKLVTSSFPLPNHLSSSSSTSSPSFRSDSVRSSTVSAANLSLSVAGASNNVTDINNKNKLPFLLANKKKKMANIVYKRSQSTTAYGGSDLTPRKRNGFWSFLHIHSYKQHSSSSKKMGNFQTKHTEKALSETETRTVGTSGSKRVNGGESSKRDGIDVIVEEDVVTTVTGSERRVSRSRSVGCGSRSFSGEFFERITHGFGDCTLRRVESQREGNNNKGKVSSNSSSNVCVRDQIVRCGGIFRPPPSGGSGGVS